MGRKIPFFWNQKYVCQGVQSLSQSVTSKKGCVSGCVKSVTKCDNYVTVLEAG